METSTLSRMEQAPSSSSNDIVSLELAKLGAIPLHTFADQTFLRSLYQPGFDPLQYSGAVFPPGSSSLWSASGGPNNSLSQIESMMEPHDAFKRLNELVTNLFGNSSSLNYKIHKEPNCDLKKCVLTVSLPNGMTRIYTTAPVYYRKVEAKSAAALVAVKNHVVDFLNQGQSTPHSSSNAPQITALAPLQDNAPSTKTVGQQSQVTTPVASSSGAAHVVSSHSRFDHSSQKVTDIHSPINLITDCCKEVHGDSVIPRWYQTQAQSGSKNNIGALLTINLTPSIYRLFTTSPVHDTYPSAILSCAQQALNQGVIEFIRNGKSVYTENPISASHPLGIYQTNHIPEWLDSDTGSVSSVTRSESELSLTSSTFLSLFPKGSKELAVLGEREIERNNPVGSIAKFVHALKDPQVKMDFVWIHPSEKNGKNHGALITLTLYTRPTSSTPTIIKYLLPPHFIDRKQARLSAHLFAISRGLLKHFEEVLQEGQKDMYLESISDGLKGRAESCWMQMTRLYKRLYGIGKEVEVRFQQQHGAWGAKLSIKLPTSGEKRSWNIRTKYRSKEDAKLVTALYAIENGLLDFLKKGGLKVDEGEEMALNPAPDEGDIPGFEHPVDEEDIKTKSKTQSIHPSQSQTLQPGPQSTPASAFPSETQLSQLSARSSSDSTKTYVHPLPTKPSVAIVHESRKRPRTPSPPPESGKTKRTRRNDLPSSSHSPPDDPSKGADIDIDTDMDLLRITEVDTHSIPTLTELNEFCKSNGLPVPTLSSSLLVTSRNERVYCVWMILGSNKYELPVLFGSEEEGYERIVKSVLGLLRKESGS